MADRCGRVVLVVKASKVGERALKKALEIMQQRNCETLGLLFVIDEEFFRDAAIGYVRLDDVIEKGLEGIADAVLTKMERLIEKEGKPVKHERILLHGNTAEEVLKFVKENDVDILVIPRDKRGPIERFLVGGDITPFVRDIEKYCEVVLVE